jgi:PTS system fructose-specific IIC component
MERKMEKKKVGTMMKDAMMTGISYMIPVVIAGAIIMAIGNLMAGKLDPTTMEGTVAYYLYTWGKMLFNMLNIVLGMYTAFRIGNRLAIPAGLVAGMVAKETSAGFIGAVVGGIAAGFLVDFLNKKIKIPASLAAAKTLVIVPFLSCLIIFPFMYVILVPVATWFINILTGFLNIAQTFSPFIFGGCMAALVALGMGSFPGWAAFAVAMVILQNTGSYQGFTAMTVGGACCNLGIAFAILAAKKKFTVDERAGITSLIAGWLVCITEMQIPYALSDPKRVFPALLAGSFVGGGLVYTLNLEVPALHGGMIVAPLVNNPTLYALTILATAVTTALVLIVLKPNLPQEESGIEA